MNTARIGVVIVSYCSEKWLDRCLDSVLTDPRCGPCVLVDNDGSGQRAGSRPGVTYLRSSSNVGFGRGCNQGFATLAGEPDRLDIFATINPDTWLEEGWGDRMLDAFDNNSDYGILSPLQMTYESGEELAPWTQAVLGDIGANPPPIVPVQWPEGSALFIRRLLWDRLGGFDPLFQLYFEEVDLCRRARRLGNRAGVVTSARYHHATGDSFDHQASPQRDVHQDLGRVLYIVTEPHQAWLAHRMSAVSLVIRGGRQWLPGNYPGFANPCFGKLKQLRGHRRQIQDKCIKDSDTGEEI